MENITFNMDINPAGEPKVPYSSNDDLDSNGLLKMNDQNGRYFPVAIVGIGLRMPDAETVPEFENVMIEGRCAIKPIPADRWHFEDFYDPDQHTKGHYCIPKMALCDKFFHFDPGYFNICPREAHLMDPQQRQTLEITEEALQDAGYTKDTLPKDTGVFVGIGIMDFPGSLMENRYLFNGHSLTGISQSCAANRISHHYGLTGPSIAVDTACAASLTALHVGCMSLWNHENKVALAGATSNIFSPETTVAFSHLGVLSATGNSAPFDESNNGYVRGEGTSIVVMKPLDDAIRDGDHIYCVIRASTSAHNGNSNSLTLPSADAQEGLIRRCYKQVGVPLDKISFVEAHGTGTPVGDPLETRALGRTFGAARKAASLGPLPIQSAKSNFGHLEVCAGMVQVVKTALMLEKRFYYKQINWTAPNPRINFDDLHMYIPVTAEPYTRDEKFVIGVNTFGFGGSLVHMIFEEYRPRIKSIADKETNNAGWSFGSLEKIGRKIAIPLSAKVGVALRNTVEKWLTWEDPADAQSVVGWLATRRDHFIEHRMVVLANSGAEFRKKLRRWLDGEEQTDVITGSKAVIYEKPNICMVYSGWGQQYPDMGRHLYKNSPIFKAAVDECDVIFRKHSGYSALEKFLIFIDDSDSEGKSPDMIDGAACKPGILFLQVGLTHLLGSWGVKPDVVMGIGLGGQIAAYASGAMSLDTIIKLMHIRMTSPPKDDFLKEVRSTLNGSKPSSSKFISTVTGEKFDGALNADYWWQNIASAKKATAAIDSALDQNPNTIFIEVAASPCLKNVIQAAAEKKNVADNVFCCGEKNVNDWDTAQQMMASLHVSGYPVNWTNITRHLSSYAPIPLYGWDDRLYRAESRGFGGRRQGITDRSYKNVAGEINMDLFTYLRDYSLNDAMAFPAAGYIEYFSEYDYSMLSALKDIRIHKNIEILPLSPDGYLQTVRLCMKHQKSHLSVVAADGEVMAEATLGKANHISRPQKLVIESILQRCSDIKEGSVVYNKFANEGLTYGMYFKLIKQIHIGDMEALAMCCAPHSTNRFEKIETLLLDNAFQTAIAAFTNGPSIYMPSAVEHLQMYVEKIPPTTEFSVHASLKEWSQKYIICDVTIADNNGAIWLTMNNFRADNTSKFVTDVDYDVCCYTTKWQSANSKMPYTINVDATLIKSDILVSDDASRKLHQLRPPINALSCEALDQAQNPLSSAKLNRLSNMDSSQKSSDILSEQFRNSTTATSCEMSNLKNIAECIAKLPEGDSYDHRVTRFLRESSVLEKLIAPYRDMIKTTIMKALAHKDVIRVCEFGDKSAVLTRMIIHSLEDEIESTKVDYTFAGHDGEQFKEVNEYLADLPVINFEQLDDDTIVKLQGSYDLVISLVLDDNAPVSLEIVKNLLRQNGLVILLKSASFHLISDFTSVTQDSQVTIDACMLTNAGFVDVLESHCSETSAMRALIGQKGMTNRVCGAGGSTAIIHNNMPDVARDLKAQLAGECQIYSLAAFDEDTLNNKKAVTVILLLGNDPDVDQTMDLLTLLSTQEEDIIKTAYGIAGTGDPESNTASCVGILQQMRRNCPFPLYAVDIRSTNHLVPAIVSAMYDISKSDLQIRVESNEMTVPRIIPYDVVHNASKDDAWQLNFVRCERELSVRYHGIQISALMPDEVKISIRAVAMNENSSDSVIAYAGRVEDTGSSVNTLVIGDAVMGLDRAPLSSHIVCDAQHVQRKPNNLSWAEAADSLLSYCTVYNALTEQSNIKPGETILIHPPQGSLCQAAANIVRLKGARVISTYDDASEYVNAVQRLGVITMANPYDSSFQRDIMNLTNNAGIDAVLQLTSDDLPSTCDDIMAYGVRICKLGATRSTVSSIPNARYSALHLSSYMKRSEKRVQNIVRLVADHLDSSTLLPVNEEVSHIANAAADLQTLSNDTISKTVVFEIPDDYVPSQIQAVDFRLRSDAAYIVTGGYSRLGLELSRWLSDKGAKHVAMISSENEESVFVKATQKYMECNNTKVYCIEKSISSPEDARRIIQDLQQQCTQPIRGIFNLAGYDANLTSHDPEDIKLTLSKQFLGVQLLDKESVSLNLDHFVLFTSVDTIRGTETLTSRAAVGAALEALCETRRTAGRCGLCLQLGQIRGVGASGNDNQELSEMAEAAGSKSFHFHEYLTILGSLLQKDELPTTVAITNQDWNKTLASSGNGSLTYKHLCTANGIQESSGGVDERELIIQKCKDFVGSLTGSNPDIIDSSHPMTEYGVDSLMSQDIINWAQKTFKVTLLQTAIFGGLTIDQLLDKV